MANYIHSNDWQLNNLHTTLEYNQNGEPHMRVKVDAGTVTVTEIDLGVVEIANDEGNPIPTHTHLYDENDNEYTDSNRLAVDITGQAVYTNGYHQPSAFAAIDNYDDAGSNVGWKFQDDWIPAFGLRVKPGSETEFHLVDFSITLNGGTSVVAGYRWYMNATLRDSYTWVDLGSTGIQYVKFDDIDGTPNLITSDTMVHSKAMVGKSTQDLTPEMKNFPFTDGSPEMFLEIRRLDGGATQDMFYHLTMGID